MTTARTWRFGVGAALFALWVLAAASPTFALQIDDRGEMRLGLRAYTAARIGTEVMGSEENPLTFPHSGAGHLRQNRYFLELKFDHDLTRLTKTSIGFAWLFGLLNPNRVSYSLQYRGEGEGIYDYGPQEFSDQGAATRRVRIDVPPVAPFSPTVPEGLVDERVARVNRNARQRHRFFLGYFDYQKGPVFVRIGRQILAWGETDVFRLLDNINPLDDSFGGFFIALDERRRPLDMLRTSYEFGSIGPLSDAFLEGFGALGNEVATAPGIPPGSPWEPGGLGRPNPAVRTTVDKPDKAEFRGGARFVFNWADVTYTIAHYYTYLDVPGVQFKIPGAAQLPGETAPSNTPRYGNEILAIQRFPRVPITGVAATTALPSIYSVLRGEAAYFQDEPMNRQGRGASANAGCPTAFACAGGAAGGQRLRQNNNTEGGLDPFVYPGFLNLTRTKPIWGRVLQRDTFNMALGLDVNRFVRWINPTQTLFVSTQFFYKHVFDSPGDLILPVPFRNIAVAKSIPIIGTGCGTGRACNLRPRLIHLNDDRFLQTLLITTSYSGGRILPSWGMFYDWQGTYVLQPGITLVRDPFRFITDYSRVQGPPSGQFGAVRDRDNVRFQVEYVF